MFVGVPLDSRERPVDSAVTTQTRVAQLAHLHYAFIWRLLKRLGAVDAEDACQQVFTVLWKRLEEVPVGKERAYLVGIAVKVAADCRRTMRRRPEEALELDQVAAPFPDASELLDQRRARLALDDMLSTLPADLREAFVLVEIEELKLREVAELLDIPPGTAASRLRRAREAFQQELTRRRSRETEEA